MWELSWLYSTNVGSSTFTLVKVKKTYFDETHKFYIMGRKEVRGKSDRFLFFLCNFYNTACSL
jgi:ATP-dependent DNA ligase